MKLVNRKIYLLIVDNLVGVVISKPELSHLQRN